MAKSSPRAWAQWLHLACKVPIDHVALVIGVGPSEVQRLLATPPTRVSSGHAERMRTMRAAGATFKAIGEQVGFHLSTVRMILLRGPVASIPTRPPNRIKPGPSIHGPNARRVRALRDLDYSAERIAELLGYEPAVVTDFIQRLTPVRKSALELSQPRDRSDEQARIANQARAAERQRDRLIAAPPAGWTYRDRSTVAEVDEWARFREALREAKLSAAELAALVPRLYYAPPKSCPGPPVPEPAIWTGPGRQYVGNPKLTPEMRAEIHVLRSQGWSTGALAKRYGVTRATICNMLLNRTFNEKAADQSPAPLTGGPFLLLDDFQQTREIP